MEKEKRALIFGIGGQDGSYLAEVLLRNGYVVYGTTRKSSVDNLWRIQHIKNNIKGVHRVELTDLYSIQKAIYATAPHEIYHEADQDNVGWSHSIPGYTFDVTVKGTLNILETVRIGSKETKVFIPVSSTMFGDAPSPQDETTIHNPLSPYACAKLAVYQLARYYRQVHGLWVSTGILYNHDSPRRKGGYLLQEIMDQLFSIATGKSDKNNIVVGSLEQIVDIGYAREFAEGIHGILQCKVPTDIILSSGRSYKIFDIISRYVEFMGLERKGVKVIVDPTRQVCAKDIELIGDIRKAQQMIGWNPKYNALNMVEILSLANTDMRY